MESRGSRSTKRKRTAKMEEERTPTPPPAASGSSSPVTPPIRKTSIRRKKGTKDIRDDSEEISGPSSTSRHGRRRNHSEASREAEQPISGPSSPHSSTKAKLRQLDLDADKEEEITTPPLSAEEDAVEASTSVKEVEAFSNDIVTLHQELDRLKREMSFKNDLLETQRSTMSDMYQQCTCTICLELLWRPFILAPCGHVFCASCLVAWFKQPLEREPPLPISLSGEARTDEQKRRTLKRKKVCPACRTELACPPVEVWLIKGMLEKVESFVSSSDTNLVEDYPALEAAKLKAEALPAGAKVWEGIFDGRGPRRILHDTEDGVRRCGDCASEIWDGFCTNPDCGIEYSGTESNYDSDRAIQIYDLGTEEEEEHSDQFSDSEMDDFIQRDREEDEDGFLQGPRRVFGNEPIIVSDSDSENEGMRRHREEWARGSDGEAPAIVVRRRRTFPRVQTISDDDDSDASMHGGLESDDSRPHYHGESSDSDRDQEDGYETADSVHRHYRPRMPQGRVILSHDSDNDDVLAPHDTDDEM